MRRLAALRVGSRTWSRIHRIYDSDLSWSFRHSPLAIVAGLMTLGLLLIAVFAPWISPQNPFDVSSLSLLDSELPPAWDPEGDARYLLGTDVQGRDVISTIMYGLRISLVVGFCSVMLSLALGVSAGLAAGYAGGWIDAFIMRIADIKLSFPAILIALLVNGIARTLLPREVFNELALWILVFSIGISNWVQYARTVRSLTMVEKSKEYVQAAHILGQSSLFVATRHILPNTVGPITVLATINLALAILTEATLSFLGVGMPPTTPSLGTLVRVGNEYILSGLWWVVIFPSITLVLLVLAVNLLGDWLRDALNPKLR
jgi:ABC-type dipeptide/oligopeptide/nickel transport systems, permease components